MVDFAKLGRSSPAEQMERMRRDRVEGYAREEASREASMKKALVVSLVEEPRSSIVFGGENAGRSAMTFRGREAGSDGVMKGVFVVPDRIVDEPEAADAHDRAMRSMGGGDRITLAGNWKKRHWNANERGEDGAMRSVRREAWEFEVHHVAKGEHSLERMIQLNREERGVQSPRQVEVPAAARAAASRSAGNGI